MNTVITKKNRYTVIDWLRGIAIIAMIAYHTIWDLVYIHDVPIPWFGSQGAYIIQRTIRWSFLILSGFCWSMGKKQWRRGLVVLGCSLMITLVTLIAMPNDPIHFGVLTLIGCGMLLTVPFDKVFRKLPPYIGFAVCLVLFLLLEHVQVGKIGLFGHILCRTPQWLHANYFTAFLGFPAQGFHSSDYVPLIPWIFAYWMGYFAYLIFVKHNWCGVLSCVRIPPLEWLGRHSLVIYMVHQPLVYGILYILFLLIKKAP